VSRIRRGVKTVDQAKTAIDKFKKRIEDNEFKRDRAIRAISRDEYQVRLVEQKKLRLDSKSEKIEVETQELPIKKKEVEKKESQDQVKKKTSLLEDLFFSGGE
jgi:hypothetical protein